MHISWTWIIIHLGTAVVTERFAALWTDGRYYLQAEQQLDCAWMIMRIGQNNVYNSSRKYRI